MHLIGFEFRLFDNALLGHIHLQTVRYRRVNTRIVIVTTTAAHMRSLPSLRGLTARWVDWILHQAVLRVVYLVVGVGCALQELVLSVGAGWGHWVRAVRDRFIRTALLYRNRCQISICSCLRHLAFSSRTLSCLTERLNTYASHVLGLRLDLGDGTRFLDVAEDMRSRLLINLLPLVIRNPHILV